MVEGVITRSQQISNFDELENGKARPNPADTFAILLDSQVATTPIDWLSTQPKTTLLDYEVKTYTDSGGQIPSGYARQRLGLVANLIDDRFFPQPGNLHTDGQAIYIVGATITGLRSGVPYYIIESNSVSFRVAAWPGGAPIVGLTANGTIVIKAGGTYNPTNKRVEVMESVRFTARNSFMCSAIAVIKGGSQASSIWLDGFDDTTAITTIPAGHHLVTGDEIMFSTSAANGAGLPGGLGRLMSYWVRVLNSTQFTLHSSRFGALTNTSQVLFGPKPTGLYNVRLIHLNGEVDFICQFGSVIQLQPNQPLLVQIASYHNNWGVQIGG